MSPLLVTFGSSARDEPAAGPTALPPGRRHALILTSFSRRSQRSLKRSIAGRVEPDRSGDHLEAVDSRMPTAAYELLPSSSRRQQPFEASGSTRIATSTSLGRPSSAGDRLRLLVALGCKNPWLALLVLLGSLALLHELFTVGTYVYAAQRALLPGDEPIAKHAVSKEGAAWADLVGNYSYGA